MDYLIATVFCILCLWQLYRMLRLRDVIDFQIGVLAAFSIGYYCLPVWFKQLSPLANENEELIAEASLMFILFWGFLIFGTRVGRRLIPSSIAFKTHTVDLFLQRRRKLLTAAAFAIYLYYYSTQELTSYSSQDFEAFFNERGPFKAIIANIAGIALAWLSLSIALSWREKKSKERMLYITMLCVCVSLLLFVGQRLALLSPIVMLMAAFALTQQRKQAIQTLFIGILALLLISPIAVFVRESRADKVAVTAQEAVNIFSYGDSPFATIFQSIIDRGDLIHVAIGMKPHIDSDPLPGAIYYASVLLNPIPRALFPGGAKPYPLSTNGNPSGELSIYSWRTLHSNTTGSLSAFGGLVAYRELGWIGVPINGLLTGVFFVFVARWLGQGGLLVATYYIALFVNLSVMKVPPSFWEALLALMPLLPALLLIYLVETILSRYSRPRNSAIANLKSTRFNWSNRNPPKV